MIGLSDSQLEIIMSAAESMAEEKCQELLEGVAAAVSAVLQVRGQINDDDVAIAVQLGLRALIHNSDVWKEWKRNSLATPKNGQAVDAPLAGPRPTLNSSRGWRSLAGWSMPLLRFASGLRRLGLPAWRRKRTAAA
jgi:hypothetical protein